MSRKRARRPAPSQPSPEAPAPVTPPDVVDASDPTAARFFSMPAVAYDEPLPMVEADTVVRRAPVSPERRRYLGRVVGGAVAVSFAICVAAGVRVATVHAATGDAPRRNEIAQQVRPAAEVVSPTQLPAIAAPPAPAEVVAAASPDPTPAPEPARAPEPAAPESQPAVATAPPPPGADGVAPADAVPVELDPAAARDAKHSSQRALDRGDAKTAISEGERSVALDPSDAEAWLILAAAYQTKGTFSEARRCFSTCVHEAKRGPRGECAALAR